MMMMKFPSLLVAAMLLLLPTAIALAPPVDRRHALGAAFGLAFGAAAPAIAASATATTTTSPFEGTFSDPINHPGGTRTIKVIGESIGEYTLAQVEGGGGRGEPKSFVLPALIVGDRAIIIDFSPKGGPRDFTGVLEKGDIKFIRDGNRWPRLE
eukprot:CAMPEP_0119013584 /NCGR_PEP_ID=MMETSP1176-20130426/8530_1 /TAXON_ID=265551 /ORGANISM="Synedropsis recta cf, Strain CCMP1620" /LENGTH=153 /DNA_ID=CAMNT_0006966685 /DNA_START=20 /DNA_END=481 /DNA_ORIENTATION=+